LEFHSGPLSRANRCISADQNGIYARLHPLGRMLLELQDGETVAGGIGYEVLPVDEAEPP
jgi:hypothetical protein